MTTKTKKVFQINYRPPADIKRRMDGWVKKTGGTKQDLLNDALDLYMSLPEDFLAVLKKTAERMDLSVSTVIVNMLVKKVAVDSAFLKVFGPSKAMLNEFRIEGGKLLTGDELADVLEDEYVVKFQKLKENLIKTAEAKDDAEKPVVSADDFREFFGCMG